MRFRTVQSHHTAASIEFPAERPAQIQPTRGIFAAVSSATDCLGVTSKAATPAIMLRRFTRSSPRRVAATRLSLSRPSSRVPVTAPVLRGVNAMWPR
jgi:hypothetical protein